MQKYSKKEIEQIINLRKQGATLKELSEMFNRSAHAINCKLLSLGVSKFKYSERSKDDAPVAKPVTASPSVSVAPKPAPAPKPRSLDSFNPRDMIKHLYNLGYRIENNKLVFVQKTVIDMRKIMAD